MTLPMPRPTRATSTADADRSPLTREEEAALVARLPAPDARARLAAGLQGFVHQRACRYRGSGLSHDELVAAGNEGLVVAIGRFDPTKGRLTTYADAWIRKTIRDAVFSAQHAVGGGYLASYAWMARAYEDAMVATGNDDERAMLAVREAHAARGRDRMSLERTRDIVERLRGRDLSLDVPAYEQWLGGGEPTKGDVLPSAGPSPEDEAAERQARGQLAWRVRGAMRSLTERERNIVRRRWMADETLAEIGETYGLTRERIRQIEQGAMAKLKKLLARDGVELAEAG